MTKPHPIVGRSGRIEYSQSLIGCSPAASGALDEVASAFGACVVTVSLEPGDALVIDNRRALHGRTAFNPAYDGADRWLQRVLLRHHLDGDQRVVSDSRVANYPSDYRRTLAQPS